MSKTAANLVVRAAYRREGITIPFSKGQRCFSSSSIHQEAETAPMKRIPRVQVWDGIVVASPKHRGKNTRFRPDPTTPIESESEFKKNTLSRDLAAQRIETRKSRVVQEAPPPQKDEERKIRRDVDMGPIRRRQDRKADNNADAAGAALQNFRPERIHSSQELRKGQHTSNKSVKTASTTHVRRDNKTSSSAKTSRKRNLELSDEGNAYGSMSFSSSLSDMSKSEAALMEVFDGDNFAVETPLRIREPDLDTAPKEDELPDSLTVLDSQIFLDADLDDQLEEQIGRYDPYFSSQNWKLAEKARSGQILSPVEYASLTVAHNATVDPEKKKKTVKAIEQFLQRNSVPNSRTQPAL